MVLHRFRHEDFDMIRNFSEPLKTVLSLKLSHLDYTPGIKTHRLSRVTLLIHRTDTCRTIYCL